MSFFESKYRFDENHWELLLKGWNRNNPDVYVDIHMSIHNYL